MVYRSDVVFQTHEQIKWWSNIYRDKELCSMHHVFGTVFEYLLWGHPFVHFAHSPTKTMQFMRKKSFAINTRNIAARGLCLFFLLTWQGVRYARVWCIASHYFELFEWIVQGPIHDWIKLPLGFTSQSFLTFWMQRCNVRSKQFKTPVFRPVYFTIICMLVCNKQIPNQTIGFWPPYSVESLSSISPTTFSNIILLSLSRVEMLFWMAKKDAGLA